MTPPTVAATVPRRGLRAVVHDSGVVMVRNLRRYQRQPQVVVFVFIQPIMFVLLFRYVFGESIEIPGIGYEQFLIPGIVVQSVMFNSVGTSIGIAEDLKAGILDRFRSLPMAHSGVLAGRVLSDTVVSTMTIVVMVGFGYLVGFRITTSVPEALLAYALTVLLGFAFSWIAAWVGLALKEPEAVQSAGFVWMFPVAFVSSVFVNPARLPSWMETFAVQNPLTRVANVTRVLTVEGYPCGEALCDAMATDLVAFLAWMAGLVLVFAGLSARGWQRLG